MEGEDCFEIVGKGSCFYGEAVCDVGDKVDEVTEGDYAGRGCGTRGRHEDVALRLVLSILIFEVFAV